MSYANTEKLLRDAQKGGYAVGAFNFENMEMAQAIVQAAHELNAPVILQTTPGTVRYGTLPLFADMVRELANGCRAEVALHLDHGESFEMARDAVSAGYSSVMIDGSRLPFEQNIALTQSVREMAGDVPVEAELGKVGGKEDDTDGGDGCLTTPEDAREFVRRTGVCFLAVAIGTAHGVYSGIPKLDVERLARIRQVVDVPLVLHGASGVPDEQVIDCVKRGICKVNYATELRQAYTRGVRSVVEKDVKVYDPKAYGKTGKQAVYELVKQKVEVLRG